MRSAGSFLASFISFGPAADGPGETKWHWYRLAHGRGPAARGDRDRAVELGLAVRVGKGTTAEPFRYGVDGAPEFDGAQPIR
jgi:hypothetical protein